MRLIKYSFLLLMVGLWSCSDDETPPGNIDPNDPTVVIWSGPSISFEKLEGSDPSLEENQDNITALVALTRGNDGGQIFNAVSESSSDKANSPAGTEWAIGTTDNLESLNFQRFRTAVGEPKSIVGEDLVLRLVEENIYIDIRFTSWSQGRLGGFAYERSTP